PRDRRARTSSCQVRTRLGLGLPAWSAAETSPTDRLDRPAPLRLLRRMREITEAPSATPESPRRRGIRRRSRLFFRSIPNFSLTVTNCYPHYTEIIILRTVNHVMSL